MMTQSEAKPRIMAEYARWLADVWKPENAGRQLTEYQKKVEARGWQFFTYLSNERPELLQFRHVGSDPWQHPIKSWIIEYERERNQAH